MKTNFLGSDADPPRLDVVLYLTVERLGSPRWLLRCYCIPVSHDLHGSKAAPSPEGGMKGRVKPSNFDKDHETLNIYLPKSFQFDPIGSKTSITSSTSEGVARTVSTGVSAALHSTLAYLPVAWLILDCEGRTYLLRTVRPSSIDLSKMCIPTRHPAEAKRAHSLAT